MISIIVAFDKNNLIGNDDALPWHYPDDLKYFKEKTLNKTVLMGRKTFDSIIKRNNKPLPKRNNIVATCNKDYKCEFSNVKVINNLEEFLQVNHEDEIFVIGGEKVYKIALKYADRLYITHINKEYKGNVYFPSINYDNYNLISSAKCDELEFCIYERKKS